jgi:hypothetical protein
MIVIVSGCIGRFPVGGNAWSVLQYLLAIHALGHEVYYLEESGEGSWVYDYESEGMTTDLGYPTRYIRECLEPFGFGDRWIFRAGGQSLGMPLARFRSICADADLLIVLGSFLDLWRDEYDLPGRRAFVDLDPGFTQARLANGDPSVTNTIIRCERLFTVGQGLGRADCWIELGEYRWLKTVPPVSLDHWPWAEGGEATHLTSILQWRSYPAVTHKQRKLGNKDLEFPRFLDLPAETAQPFLLALTADSKEPLSRFGWDTVVGWKETLKPQDYERFIRGSRAEFSVAKHGYVSSRSGWFSDRSVCYLASGRPVVVQDTGLSDWLPIGSGVLTFADKSSALRAIDDLNGDYEGHRRAARAIAEKHFDARVVLGSLLERATS